jgi:hypothetical protein
MDVSTISQLIGSLGFPIVVSLLLIYMNYKQSEEHKQEMDKITESLNNNTVALTKLTERLHLDDE